MIKCLECTFMNIEQLGEYPVYECKKNGYHTIHEYSLRPCSDFRKIK